MHQFNWDKNEKTEKKTKTKNVKSSNLKMNMYIFIEIQNIQPGCAGKRKAKFKS